MNITILEAGEAAQQLTTHVISVWFSTPMLGTNSSSSGGSDTLASAASFMSRDRETLTHVYN